MAKRTFDPLSVVATGVQTFLDRFGKRRRYDDGTPPIAQWRCNLTGLSQVHNLFFVAYRQHIYVYVPRFPDQWITEQPILVFTSQPSANNLRGHIDEANPHAINNLIVSFLGNEEVVAVTRDDGDVDAFLVRHIVHAIERRAEVANTIGVTADEIRPIFQENVERSGWGIAIHSQARILATSSNSHEVRIFKFGLIAAEDDDSPDEDDAAYDSRKQDVTLHIVNGNTNIPHIAFCNTGDDPGGRWLLTTDIGGFCRVVDLQNSTARQTFRFGPSFAARDTGGFDIHNAGWSIMFLDRRSFQPEQNVNAALGMHNQEALPHPQDNVRIWDISRMMQNIPDAAKAFIYRRPRKQEAVVRPPLDVLSPSDQSVASSISEFQDASTRPSTAGDAQSPLEIEIDFQTEDCDDDDGGVEIEVEHSHDEDIELEEADDDESQVRVVDDMDDELDEGTEDTVSFTSFYSGDAICGNEPRFARLENGDLAQDLPCPIFHTSVRNIYLLQPSNQKIALGPWLPPMVGLANPLRQPVQQDFEYLRLFERLNMSAQIPALGVVVVASQKGRALVLSLTKLSADADHPPGTRDMSQMKTTYGMRVERILPFPSQEKQNQRPFAPLHGLAVGPVQGSADMKEEQKRFRIMLMYQDHGILSYEISRKGDRNRDSGVAVDDLVV